MIKIYISSPVSDYQKFWNLTITRLLRNDGDIVFLPQEITPENQNHEQFEIYVFNKCIEWIEKSNVGLLLLPYGRDCAWEVGYYAGTNKPLFVFISEMNDEQESRLRDWMVKGSINEIITNNENSYLKLKSDYILKDKPIHKINSLDNLPDKISKIYNSNYKDYNLPVHLGAGAVVLKNKKVLLIQETKNSRYYNRKKGMWAFPTTPIKNFSPEEQALISLKEEGGMKGKIEKFITYEHIPNATGLFYKVKPKVENENNKGKWFDIDDVLEEKIYLRPTYSKVLKKLLNVN
jgi:nucleoside 2-deoxyribosyltransferase